MIRLFLTCVTLFASAMVLYAQVPVGYKFDVNGIPFNGYYDAMIYAPEKQLQHTHLSDSYEIGYYYEKSGSKVNGLIKFEAKKIFFKQDKKELTDKIKPEEVSSFVIGIDSFFSISKYYYKNTLKTTPVYVQFIASFDDYVFAKHYKFQVGPGTVISESFMVKVNDRDTWEDFPDNKTFKEKALKYFGHIPYLSEKIKSGKYESGDMLSIIKMAEYLSKYKKQEAIFYDHYWQETGNSKKADYNARIVAHEDSIWTFDYYAGETRLYQVKYSAFHPNMKNGELICYYPSGGIRQIVNYDNNKMKAVRTYTNSGTLDRSYERIEKKKDIDFKYLVVNDAAGNNVLKPSGKSAVNVRDELNGFTYTSVFNGSELVSVYRLTDSDTIFQIVDPDYDSNMKSMAGRFASFIENRSYEGALSVDAQGKILVSIVVDPDGYAVKYSFLNQVHPELDALVEEYVKKRLFKGGSQVYYKTGVYKKDKIARYYEVVIPFNFNAARFYRQPVDMSNLNQMHWMNHQMMMNRPPVVTPPNFH